MYIKFEGKIFIPPVSPINDTDVIDNIDKIITNNYSDENIIKELHLKWELVKEKNDDTST